MTSRTNDHLTMHRTFFYIPTKLNSRDIGYRFTTVDALRALLIREITILPVQENKNYFFCSLNEYPLLFFYYFNRMMMCGIKVKWRSEHQRVD